MIIMNLIGGPQGPELTLIRVDLYLWRAAPAHPGFSRFDVIGVIIIITIITSIKIVVITIIIDEVAPYFTSLAHQYDQNDHYGHHGHDCNRSTKKLVFRNKGRVPTYSLKPVFALDFECPQCTYKVVTNLSLSPKGNFFSALS